MLNLKEMLGKLKTIFKRKDNCPAPKKRFIFLLIILMIGSFALGMYWTGHNQVLSRLSQKENVFFGTVFGKFKEDSAGHLTKDVDFDLYWKLWEELKTKYVDKNGATEKQMFYGSLKGMAASLNDPYTIFMDPAESKEFNSDLSGTFEGIGAEIGLKNDVITVVAPLAGLPAEKAGIKSGDKIIAIDGVSTSGLSADGAVMKIRGPKGTKVKLTIFRQGFETTKDFEIERDIIYVKSVKTKSLDNNLFLITVSSFNEDTEKLFSQAVSEAMLKKPKGIIIDLRNNPGGFLNTSVAMIGEWIKNDTAVTEKTGDPKNDITYTTNGAARLKGYPTVVLVNGGSASASEILAGALKDYGVATIVGEKTYGKGSVQSLEDLSDGSSLKVTVAKWFTPKGNSINEIGITPDVEVKLTQEDFDNNKDPQLDKAIEILKSK